MLSLSHIKTVFYLRREHESHLWERLFQIHDKVTISLFWQCPTFAILGHSNRWLKLPTEQSIMSKDIASGSTVSLPQDLKVS